MSADLSVLSDADLEAAARDWLAANAPAFCRDHVELSTFGQVTDELHADSVCRARAWEAHRAAAGWAGLAVPQDLGGQGRSLAVALRFDELEHQFALPLDVCLVSRAMVLPTLLAWGTRAQQGSLVRPLLDGTDLWCQLFSEPGAGSDLAAVRTRAEAVDDGWIINGHKIWTSFGADSDRGYLLARTGSGRHDGLSAFLVDMHLPGVAARPIRQATGAQTFSEVFLDDVRLPADSLLGEVGGGWRVVHTTLMNERLALTATAIPLQPLVALAREHGALDDVTVRRQLVRLHTRKRIAELVRAQIVAAVAEEREPGPEGSIAKILVSRGARDAGELAARIRGADALLDDEWFGVTLGAYGLANGGGTEEILKTMLGERVLGLPRSPRPQT